MTTRAAKTRFPVVPTEAEEATDDSPPRPCLVFALRNAFINLDDAELEFEVAIERRRRCVPFIKALRNAFLHIQWEQFEAEIAIEKQRRRDSRKKSPAKEQIIINSSNNIKTSKVELLADIQAKLSITKSIMKLAPATIKNDGAARNSAISNNETTSIDNEGRLERVMMMATRDRLSHTERIPLGRWHKEDGSNNNIIATPTTNTNTNNNNSSETQSFPVAKAHMETIPTTFAPASAGGGETTTLINKKRPPSFDDDNDAETESEDEETETEKQDEGEVEIADDDDSSWNSADSIMTGLGSKKAAYTSKFFVGTPLPATTLGHNVNQPGNDNVSLWTEEEDICLKKIMKRDRHHKKISRNWDVIAKEMGRNRT